MKAYRWLTKTWKDTQHCSLLEKCRSKLQWDTTSYQSEWPSSKCLQTINAGVGVEIRKPSCIAGGNVNWYNHYGKWYGDFFKKLGVEPPSVSSVQFSRSVMSASLRPHESQHARPPCPSPTPGVYSNSCPLSWWCHPAISFSVIPFSFCPNLFQHQGLFQWVNSLHKVAKVLEFQPQHQSFQWTPRTDLL